MTDGKNGLTYAQAGVDIDAGNALVERIKPAARTTDRPGTMGGLGGFGALFDLKAAGYDDPLLVTTTDGVGTKLKVAIETGLPSAMTAGSTGASRAGICSRLSRVVASMPARRLRTAATSITSPFSRARASCARRASAVSRRVFAR